MALVYSVCNAAFRGVLGAFADWHVYGRENVPQGEPFLVISNHQSSIDPPLIGASLGRQAKFLAKGSLFRNPLLGAFLRSYGAFPLKRDGTDLEGSMWALGRLKAGEPLVLFPEGSRSSGGMKRALPGAAFLALKAGVPIVPAGITGSDRLGPIWRIVVPTGRITVTFGQAFMLPAEKGRPDRDQLESLTQLMMGRVAALLPLQYRGVYRGGPNGA